MTIDTSSVKLAELLGLAISLLALAISLISVVYVYVQVKAQARQQQMDFHVRLIEINRELLRMGFDHPELLTLLRGEEIADKDKQTRFIQMWINQSLIMWLGKEQGTIGDDAWYSLRRDIATFINRPPMKIHWQQVAPYYIPAFANFMNGLVRAQEEKPEESTSLRNEPRVRTMPVSNTKPTENNSGMIDQKRPLKQASSANKATLITPDSPACPPTPRTLLKNAQKP
jgi:hypothetical protein